ncbi:P-loop containing nucleoside triphosphate hydrolase protein [Mycena sp. CBHHK59/15]|nr:P-loop containing nucleoside triphosphate hydrolase protein [Mycena sp. CBHHK59/15]
MAVDEKNVTGPPIQSMQLGVYRVVTEILPPISPIEHWRKAKRLFPTLARLTRDVYSVGPGVFFLFIITEVWISCLEPTLTLHLSSRILSVIEAGLRKGSPDGFAIFLAVALRMTCLIFTTAIRWWSVRFEPVIQHRIEVKFQNYILRSKLGTDLSTVQANLSTDHVSERTSFVTFKYTIKSITKMLGVLGQLGYVFRIVRSSGHGPVFGLLCIAQPILEVMLSQSLWSKAHVVEATDPHFLRMKGLRELSEPKYKQDVITGDIVQYIIREFRRAVSLLGDTDVSGPSEQYRRRGSSLPNVVTALAGDLPMLYYAGNAILNPTKFSLASIATLQKSEQLLSWTFLDVFYNVQTVKRLTNSVKMVYDLEKTVNESKMKDGELPYPPLDCPHEQGMPFELKNVSFMYPGATKMALDNISLHIPAGQLIVLVGANGSGKSTIVKLLTRLYDATSGAVLIEGQDIKNYKMADMRCATAALTQDHHLYPLSLGENIGLGNPDHVADMDMIRAAAAKGGADGVVAKLADGFETVLEHPRGLKYGSSVKKTDKTLLGAELEKMMKEGMARTFMRFTSGAVRLVCVDEPSSSLDPEGEWELFKNLRLVREGKTMVFVTHRFGHLTRHADAIVCMKDGAIIESGTHEELMTLSGEYCKMYKIQANAFN